MIDALINNDVDLLFFWTFATRTRRPPELDVAALRVAHYVGSRHGAGYLLLRYHHQRMMEEGVQEEAEHDDRFVFAEFIDKKACAQEKIM